MKHRRKGFTLIELIVVIAIIIILAALLFPAVNAMRRKAKLTRARAAIGQLDVALRGYLDEYGRPFGNIVDYGNWPGDGALVEDVINGIQVEMKVLQVLAGSPENIPRVLQWNPKLIPFCDTPTSNELNDAGSLIDPWGNPYKFMFDYNNDKRIDINFTDFSGKTSLYQRVAVWSRGPDGSDKEEFGGWDDDIKNWR